MRPLLFLTTLFLCAPALATDCGVVRGEGVVSVVVGAKGGNCFAATGFREAFLADLNKSLAVEQAASESRAPRPAPRRSRIVSATAQEQPGGRYYGQR